MGLREQDRLVQVRPELVALAADLTWRDPRGQRHIRRALRTAPQAETALRRAVGSIAARLGDSCVVQEGRMV
jgi:hypothetical protein